MTNFYNFRSKLSCMRFIEFDPVLFRSMADWLEFQTTPLRWFLSAPDEQAKRVYEILERETAI